jgi:hypothetical protein
MCNQNIISNKFDLILTTKLSSYLPRTLRPNPDRRDTPATTEAIQGPGITPTETGNTASTANYRTIHRTNVSKEFEKRNRAEIDKGELTGLECT